MPQEARTEPRRGRWTERRFHLDADLALALTSLTVFWGLFFLGANAEQPWVSAVVFLGLTHVVVGVAFPAYLVLWCRGEPLDALGLDPARWGVGLATSAGIAAVFSIRLIPEMGAHPLSVSVPTVLALAFGLGEPLFVHGWLQGRFERSFGPIPAILLTGLAFGLYHVGTFPPQAILFLVAVGIGFAALYRATRSLLAVWPLTYASLFSIGTLEMGSPFTWWSVWAFGMALVVELVVIAWMARRGPSTQGTAG